MSTIRLERYEKALQRIAALPPEQEIYCKNGHAGLKKYEHEAVKIAREALEMDK